MLHVAHLAVGWSSCSDSPDVCHSVQSHTEQSVKTIKDTVHVDIIFFFRKQVCSKQGSKGKGLQEETELPEKGLRPK